MLAAAVTPGTHLADVKENETNVQFVQTLLELADISSQRPTGDTWCYTEIGDPSDSMATEGADAHLAFVVRKAIIFTEYSTHRGSQTQGEELPPNHTTPV